MVTTLSEALSTLYLDHDAVPCGTNLNSPLVQKLSSMSERDVSHTFLIESISADMLLIEMID